MVSTIIHWLAGQFCVRSRTRNELCASAFAAVFTRVQSWYYCCMPRAIWTGTISFGLVTVPVKLYSAVDRKSVRFHQLSGKTGVRVSQKRVDPSSGEEVAYADIVKGYELAPDRYVVVEPGELDALEPRKTKTIEIEEFVALSEIDPVYYDHPYYLAPGPGGAKPYRLLLDAMRAAGKVAIARVVIRSKEQLVAVRPMGDTLGMATMLFADEVLSPERLDEIAEVKEVTTTARELDIATQLIDSLAGDFEPERFRDTYREQVLELIERKAAGKAIAVQPEPEEAAAPAPDLMSALKASLDAVRAREDAPTAAVGAKPRKAAKKAPAKKAAAKKAAAKKPDAAKKPTAKR
jgi:DNA end-binding protein Ku